MSRAGAPRIRGVLVAAVMLGVLAFSGSGMSHAAIGDPTTIPGDTTTTAVGATTVPADTTTTVVVGSTTLPPTTTGVATATTLVPPTTTLPPTTTTLVPPITTTPPPTTTIAPTPNCAADVTKCVTTKMVASFVDTNGNKLVDAGDIVSEQITVTAVGPGVTNPTLSIPLPQGVGNVFTGFQMNGVQLTPAVDGDAGDMSFAVATVRLPSPLPDVSVVLVSFQVGKGIPLVAGKPTLQLGGHLAAIDVNLPVSIEVVPVSILVDQRLADLSLTVNLSFKDDPRLLPPVFDWPTVGGRARFTVMATNIGPDPVASATVRLQLPAVADLTAVTIPASCERAVGVVTCVVKLDGAGKTIALALPIEFSLLPTAVDGTEITLQGQIESAVFDANPTNNLGTATAKLDLPTDIGVAFVDLVDPWVAGTQEHFKIAVTNNGPADAHSIPVTVTIPAAVLLVSAPYCNKDGATTSCLVPFLASQQTTYIEFVRTNDQGQIAADNPLGPISFGAVVVMQPARLNTVAANDQVARTVQVVGHADLSVSFLEAPTAVTAGKGLTIKGFVSNQGPSTANFAVTIAADPLITGLAVSLAGATCVTGSTGKVICTSNAGQPLIATKSRILVISGTALANATFGSGVISASVVPLGGATDDSATSDRAQVSIEFRGVADLRTTVKAPSLALAGTPLEFRVEVSNAGPSDATGVTLNLKLSASLVRVVVTADDRTVVCPDLTASNLACGPFVVPALETRTFTVTGTTSADEPSGSLVTVSAAAKARQEDENPDNDSGSASVSVSLDSTLVVQISSDPGKVVTAGQDVSYVIVVRNIGKTRSNGATVTITKPDGFKGRNPSNCADLNADRGGQWVCAVKPFLKDDVATFRIEGQAASNLPAGSSFALAVTVTDSTPSAPSSSASVGAEIVVKSTMAVVPTLDPSVIAGNTFLVKYSVANAGPSDAQRVILTLSIPAKSTLLSGNTLCATTLRSTATTTGTMVCDLATITALSQVAVAFQFTSDASLDNGSNLTFRDGLGWESGTLATDERSVTVETRADIRLRLDGTDKAIAGTAATATLSVTNDGPSESRDVQFSLPAVSIAKMRVERSSPDLACVIVEAAGLRCSATSAMSPGTTRLVSIVFDIDEAAPDPSEIRGEANLAASTKDPEGANNRAMLAVSVSSVADVVATFEQSPTEVKVGALTVVLLKVSNKGPSTARDVFFDVAPPSVTSLIVAGGGADCRRIGKSNSLHCVVGSMAARKGVTMQFQGVLGPSPFSDGPIPLFKVTAQTSTQDPGLTTDGVTGNAILVGRATTRRELTNPNAFTKLNSTVQLGAEIKNTGEPLKGVLYVQDIPEGQRLVEANATQGTCDLSRRMVLCAIGILEAGESARVRITTVVDVVPVVTPLITMSAYVTDTLDGVYVVDPETEAFVRPPVRPTPSLVVSPTSPLAVKKLTTANAPLFSGVGLSVLFGFGLLGWVRRGRREDPLETLA